MLSMGLPPVYGAALSIRSPKHPHASRVALLRKKAEEAMDGRSPLRQSVVMVVSQVYTQAAMADAANVVGAISNALEGIVYENDRLIRRVHFVSESGRRSVYSIKVVPLSKAS